MADKSEQKIGVLGAGWLGLPLVKNLRLDDISVRASSRDTERLNEVKNTGAEAYKIDLPDAVPTAFFAGLTGLVITLPPGGRKLGERTTEVYVARLQSILSHFTMSAGLRVVFCSSTGVYGAAAGSVDERSPLAPRTHSARAVVAAEDLLRAAVPNLVILRLAGLVGPSRHPGNFFGGKNIPLQQGDAPVNLVHQTDAVAALRLALMPSLTVGTYNVCAAAHPPKGAFYGAAAGAVGLTVGAISGGGDNGKVIDSSKIRAAGWACAYDDISVEFT